MTTFVIASTVATVFLIFISAWADDTEAPDNLGYGIVIVAMSIYVIGYFFWAVNIIASWLYTLTTGIQL